MTPLWIISAIVIYISIAVIATITTALIDTGSNETPNFEDDSYIIVGIFWPIVLFILLLISPLLLVRWTCKWLYINLKDKEQS